MIRIACVILMVVITVTGSNKGEYPNRRTASCPNYLRMLLYTKSHQDGYEINAENMDDSLKHSPVNLTKEIKFFSWTPQLENATFLNLSQIIEAYTNEQDVNFIVIKWNETSDSSSDSSKYEKMYNEAECLSNLIKNLSKIGAESLRFHLIAHNFKATTFSMAGQMAYPLLIGRLSALDPSRDTFSIRVRYQAAHVKIPVIDVIYTSLSKSENISAYGHATFFPNGGYHPQPGVLESAIHESSVRSVAYWAESVHSSDIFWSLRCNDATAFFVNKVCLNSRAISVMGEHVSPRTRGYFYLTTNDKAPFGKGKDGALQSADSVYHDEYEYNFSSVL